MQKLKPKKAQLAKLIVSLALVVVAMYFVSKCSRLDHEPFKSDFAKAGGDTLDIAIEMNPSIYSVHGDSISGIDYEMLTNISKRHGVPIKFHPFVPLSHAIEGLEKGNYDVVVASIPATSEIKDKYLITDAAYLDREILVQLRDTTGHGPITSQLQLGGDTVWIASDSPFRSRIENLAKEIGDTIHVMSSPEYSAEHLFILVAKGVIKNAVINENVAEQLSHEFPEVDIETPVSFTQFQPWVLRNDNEALRDSLNAWLKQEKELW